MQFHWSLSPPVPLRRTRDVFLKPQCESCALACRGPVSRGPFLRLVNRDSSSPADRAVPQQPQTCGIRAEIRTAPSRHVFESVTPNLSLPQLQNHVASKIVPAVTLELAGAFTKGAIRIFYGGSGFPWPSILHLQVEQDGSRSQSLVILDDCFLRRYAQFIQSEYSLPGRELLAQCKEMRCSTVD